MAGLFHRFVKGFSVLESPLTDVLRDDVQFVWGEGLQVAFQRIKDTLTNPPVLKFLDLERPFTLVTDASNDGIGACLMQKFDGRLHPLAFYSRKFKHGGVTDACGQ